MDTNPVQQRMEYLLDVWNDIPKEKIKVIRTLIYSADYEMLDAFHWYMLGLKTPVKDITIFFESEFRDSDSFGTNLIKELETTVKLWNKTEFSEGINKIAIDWKPDYSLSGEDEQQLFISNLNALCESLKLQKGRNLIANLLIPHNGMDKKVLKWLMNLAGKEFSKQVKVMVTDYVEKKLFENLAFYYPDDVYTWEPDIDTPNVICQTASMGDPLDPGTDYRSAFARMMKAIGKKNYRETIRTGEECIEIAKLNMSENPHWLAQVAVVLITLSNEDFKYGYEAMAFKRADIAVRTARKMPQLIGDELGCPVSSQALINKATMHCYKKSWKEAAPLFEEAAANYEKANIHINAMESYRMAGYCYAKKGESYVARDNLVHGYKAAGFVDDGALRASSFSILLTQLLKEEWQDFISEEELDRKATAVFGNEWWESITKIWKDTDIAKLYENNIYMTEQQNNKENDGAD